MDKGIETLMGLSSAVLDKLGSKGARMEGLALVAGVAFVGGAVVQKLTGMMGNEGDTEKIGDSVKARLQNKKAGGRFRNLKALNLTKHEMEVSSAIIESGDIPVDFNSIGGLAKQVEEIYDMVIAPLAYPELYSQSASAQRPTGLLLYGPPGTGKTSLAKAVAKTSGASFLAITAAMITSRWAGETPKLVEAVFSLARKMSPCVIFIDEVDGLLSTRNDSDGAHMSALKTTFMHQWDGIYSSSQSQLSDSQNNPLEGWILVIGATNRPQSIDDAVMRRFPRKVFVGMPDHEARVDILQVLLKGEKCAPDLDLDAIAAECENFSGSDLKELVRLAATRCIRDAVLEARRREKLNHGQGNLSPESRKKNTETIQPREITTNDLIEALDDLTPSGPKAQENWKLVGPEWDGTRKAEGHARDRIAARRYARNHSMESAPTNLSDSTLSSPEIVSLNNRVTIATNSIDASTFLSSVDNVDTARFRSRTPLQAEKAMHRKPKIASSSSLSLALQRPAAAQGGLINAALSYASDPTISASRSMSVQPRQYPKSNSKSAYTNSQQSMSTVEALKPEKSTSSTRSKFYFLPDTPNDDRLSDLEGESSHDLSDTNKRIAFTTPSRRRFDPSDSASTDGYSDTFIHSSVVARALNLSPYSAISGAITKQQLRDQIYNETLSPEEVREAKSSLRDNSAWLTSSIEEASQATVNAILNAEKEN